MPGSEITNECYVHANDIRDFADVKGASLELAHRYVLAAFNARGIWTKSDALFHEPEHLHCLCVVDGAVTWRREDSDDCKRKISIDDLMARPATIIDELLAALKNAENVIRSYQFPDPVSPDDKYVSEVRKEALRVIAKAEGRS